LIFVPDTALAVGGSQRVHIDSQRSARLTALAGGTEEEVAEVPPATTQECVELVRRYLVSKKNLLGELPIR
jgi:hypothetical protein